ncbi:hypothetical protein PV326_005655 [Microctonus aethiopoides]|nr:hypothetical protein PV326_005655 [Microctonus aethiopoides]
MNISTALEAYGSKVLQNIHQDSLSGLYVSLITFHRLSRDWLNLTDRTILCGHKFYDGTGVIIIPLNIIMRQGYLFPLTAKLGTITNEGEGGVYSYDKNDTVEDPDTPDLLILGIHVILIVSCRQFSPFRTLFTVGTIDLLGFKPMFKAEPTY